ncbi:hypothetical protein [Microbacterium testaceum]|uniref:hypothetical protein n=1 Tax=Microbacterium testaceum TaxID=2033 RepID=UPI0022E1AB90|nr:hypothetical protein [Microbacterium testaceum]
MIAEEVVKLLSRMSIVDGRDVDQVTLEMWEPLVADLDYVDAVEGLNNHYRTDSRRPTPAHLRTAAEHARRDRLYADVRTRDQCIPHRHSLRDEPGSCRDHHADGKRDDRCVNGCY